MKVYSYLLAILSLVALFSCSESEKPEEKESSFNYFLKIDVENKKYEYGYNERGDEFNPREVYNGVSNSNVMIYNSGVLMGLILDNCGIEEGRDCLSAVLNFSGYSLGTYKAIGKPIISVNNVYYSVFLNSQASDGYLSVTITKIDALSGIVEGRFSGEMYNEATSDLKLIPVNGSFRAYYKPN